MCNRRNPRVSSRAGRYSLCYSDGEWIAMVWTVTKKQYERELQRRGNR